MDQPRMAEQLSRIEQVQDRIRQVIVDETLDNLEGLIAELGSRIQTVHQLIITDKTIQSGVTRRLQLIATTQSDLEALAGTRLGTFGAKLVKARQNSMLSHKYRIEPARVNATMAKSTDIMG